MLHPHPVSYSETPSNADNAQIYIQPTSPPLRRVPACSSSMSKRHPNVRHLTKVLCSYCIAASQTQLGIILLPLTQVLTHPHIHSSRNSCPLSLRKSSPLSPTPSWPEQHMFSETPLLDGSLCSCPSPYSVSHLCFLFYLVLRIKPRALCILVRHSSYPRATK